MLVNSTATTSNNRVTACSSKAVHFKPTVRVKRIAARTLYSKEMKSKLWISQEEWKHNALSLLRNRKKHQLLVSLHPSIFQSKKKAKTRVSEEKEDRAIMNHLHLHGLESQKDRLARRSRMADSIDAVLDEQHRLQQQQQQPQHYNSCSSNKDCSLSEQMEQRISETYREHTEEAEKLALARGLEEARNVRRNGLSEDAIVLAAPMSFPNLRPMPEMCTGNKRTRVSLLVGN